MSNAYARPKLGRDIVRVDDMEVDLRNRYLAAFLAWLIPGAGHFYQRRYVKSVIFFVAVLSAFEIGMVVAGHRCVYASWNNTERRWQYVLQAGVGLPALPAAVHIYMPGRGGKPAIGGFMAPPKNAEELAAWNAETASGFDMGTLYTMIAGLLNVLAVFDAFAGPMPPPEKQDKNKAKSDV